MEPITVKATINAPVDKVWKLWTTAEDIIEWNNASDDWHTPSATNDLRPGGSFTYRMEARDGSFGFDFSGEYDDVKEHERISYKLGDGRAVDIQFAPSGNGTAVTQTFEPENTNPRDMQQGGWQAILDNFKQYAEAQHE